MIQFREDYPAFKHCNDLNHGGHTDWKLPTTAELLTLIEERGEDSTCPALGSVGFTDCMNDNYYWSESERSYTSVAYRVSFSNGNSYSIQ